MSWEGKGVQAMPPRSSSDMPSSPSSLRRDVDELKKTKSNKETTDLKFSELEKDVDETKKIALSAKKKAEEPYVHSCFQEERMKSVEDKTSGWNKWFRGIVVVVISAVIGLGSFLATVWFTKADAAEVAEVKSDVTMIKIDVSNIQESQERIEAALEPKVQLELERKRMELYKEMMKQAVIEVKADIQPKPNRRRTN